MATLNVNNYASNLVNHSMWMKVVLVLTSLIQMKFVVGTESANLWWVLQLVPHLPEHGSNTIYKQIKEIKVTH